MHTENFGPYPGLTEIRYLIDFLFFHYRSILVNVIESGCDVLVVPQATLGGKVKGKQLQYHGNINKSQGLEMYNLFCAEIRECCKSTVETGTYGNRQVLRTETEGPFSHVLDF